MHIVIQSDLFQVISLKYNGHEAFHEAINVLYNKIFEIYKTEIIRAALRYVNVIGINEGATFDFDNLINPSLLNATLDYKEFGLTRSLGSMSIYTDDAIAITFTYGFFNPEFPNRIAKREFILDYDCSINVTPPINSIKNDILLKLRSNANILFEKSILDGLRDKIK